VKFYLKSIKLRSVGTGRKNYNNKKKDRGDQEWGSVAGLYGENDFGKRIKQSESTAVQSRRRDKGQEKGRRWYLINVTISRRVSIHLGDIKNEDSSQKSSLNIVAIAKGVWGVFPSTVSRLSELKG